MMIVTIIVTTFVTTLRL